MLITLGSLVRITQLLAEHLTERDISRLKVNSGEHLAAILASAFLGRGPVGVEPDLEPNGGPDLVFPPDADAGLPAVAMEIKSLSGDKQGNFRRFEASLERASDATERTHWAEAVSINDLLSGEGLRQVEIARQQLATKVPSTLDVAVERHVFLVAHLMDYPTVEGLNDEIVALAPTLEPLPDLGGVDAVWLVLAPMDQLVVWSGNDQRWSDYFFTGQHPEADEDLPVEVFEHMTYLQGVEALFLKGIGHEKGSPYLFSLEFDSKKE